MGGYDTGGNSSAPQYITTYVYIIHYIFLDADRDVSVAQAIGIEYILP